MGRIEDEINQTKRFATPLQKIFANIVFTHGWVQQQLESVYEPFQVTPQQYNVLRILRGQHPKPVRPSDIKAVMLDKSPDITRLCDRLEAKALIHRESNPENRRQLNVRITQKGLTLLEEIEPHLQGMIKQTSKLSEDEHEQLSELLDKLRG